MLYSIELRSQTGGKNKGCFYNNKTFSQLSYAKNTALLTFVPYNPHYRGACAKESPDSTGQPTGEQPASAQAERDSATENDRPQG
jgi:hypothetical protein